MASSNFDPETGYYHQQLAVSKLNESLEQEIQVGDQNYTVKDVAKFATMGGMTRAISWIRHVTQGRPYLTQQAAQEALQSRYDPVDKAIASAMILKEVMALRSSRPDSQLSTLEDEQLDVMNLLSTTFEQMDIDSKLNSRAGQVRQIAAVASVSSGPEGVPVEGAGFTGASYKFFTRIEEIKDNEGRVVGLKEVHTPATDQTTADAYLIQNKRGAAAVWDTTGHALFNAQQVRKFNAGKLFIADATNRVAVWHDYCVHNNLSEAERKEGLRIIGTNVASDYTHREIPAVGCAAIAHFGREGDKLFLSSLQWGDCSVVVKQPDKPAEALPGSLGGGINSDPAKQITDVREVAEETDVWLFSDGVGEFLSLEELEKIVETVQQQGLPLEQEEQALKKAIIDAIRTTRVASAIAIQSALIIVEPPLGRLQIEAPFVKQQSDALAALIKEQYPSVSAKFTQETIEEGLTNALRGIPDADREKALTKYADQLADEVDKERAKEFPKRIARPESSRDEKVKCYHPTDKSYHDDVSFVRIRPAAKKGG